MPPLRCKSKYTGGLQCVRCTSGAAEAARDHHSCIIQGGSDSVVLQEGREHDGEQPLGVAPDRADDARCDQRQACANHLPYQGRCWHWLPLSCHQPLSQIITKCGPRCSANCLSALAPTGKAPAQCCISAF